MISIPNTPLALLNFKHRKRRKVFLSRCCRLIINILFVAFAKKTFFVCRLWGRFAENGFVSSKISIFIFEGFGFFKQMLAFKVSCIYIPLSSGNYFKSLENVDDKPYEHPSPPLFPIIINHWIGIQWKIVFFRLPFYWRYEKIVS